MAYDDRRPASRDARAMTALDAESRRALLLTRIAFERGQLQREVARLRQAAAPSQLLRSVLGSRTGPGWLGALASDREGWIPTALAWLRRYRFAASLAATLFGGAAPLLRRRGRWRRLVLAAALGAALWRFAQRARDGGPHGG
jgi:hypothetical protein